ncbi:MAG: hypothetical protein K8R88_05475 [Armatimonadetes bacterium]|nr:hypothetical protein [Armatimonadota bacterium]
MSEIPPQMPPQMPPQNFGFAPEEPVKKSGMPVWGWILLGVGGLSCVCVSMMAAVLFPVFSQAKLAAKQTATLSNVKQLCLGATMYSNDFDGTMMPAKEWNASIFPYTKNSLVLEDSTLPSSSDQRGIGFNSATAIKDTGMMKDPSSVVVFGQTSTPGQDAKVTLETMRFGMGRASVGFADGHATRKAAPDISKLQWNPEMQKK